MRFSINALGLDASAAEARVLAVAFDLLATTCLTSTPNSLSLIHGGPSRIEGSWRRQSFLGSDLGPAPQATWAVG